MHRLIVLIILCFTLFTVSIAESVKIVCSTDNPKESLHVITLEKFDELLHKYSNGEIDAVIHYRGNKEYPAVRGEEVNVNMVKSGRGGLNLTVVASGNVAQRASVLNFLTLPYIFPDLDSAKNLFQSKYMREDINKILSEKNDVRALGWLIGGYRHMTNSKKPVEELKDMKGLVIRTPKNRLMKDTYEAFGAKAEPINWGDTFDALKNKKIDGQENPYNVIFTSKFWNANQKYVTNNGPFLWVGPLLINEDFFQSLSSKHQKIVERAAMEASQFEWNWIENQNDNFKKALIKNGMQIYELKDKQNWINATKKLWDDYYKLIGSGDKEVGISIVDNVMKNTK